MSKWMLVEDEPDIYELLIAMFEMWGIEGVAFVDGEEAIAFLKSAILSGNLPGLILLDLNMPRKDGRELVAEIKQDPHLRRIPVVILTTSKAEEDILHSYDLGANSYIQKPVNFDKFIKVVQTLGVYWIDIVSLPSERGGCT